MGVKTVQTVVVITDQTLLPKGDLFGVLSKTIIDNRPILTKCSTAKKIISVHVLSAGSPFTHTMIIEGGLVRTFQSHLQWISARAST